MPRIVGISDPDPANALVQRAFARDAKRAGKVLQITRAGGLVPEAYDAWAHMYDTVQTMNAVPVGVKQVASLLVYMRVGCTMCLDFATVTARMKGVTEEKLRILPQYKTSPLFSEEERAVLRFAEAMTRAPAHVTDEEFEGLKQFYNDTQIMELVFHIAVTNMGGRIGRGLDFMPEGFSEGQYCLVPTPELSAAAGPVVS